MKEINDDPRKKWWKSPILPAVLIVVFVVVCGIFVFREISRENFENNTKTEDEKPKYEFAKLDAAKKVEYRLRTPTKQELLDEVNKRRAEVGVAPLIYSPALEKSAQRKCDDMVARNYFDHPDPDGNQGINLAISTLNLDGYYMENLQRYSRPDMQYTATNIFNFWFESESHKSAALDARNTITGFGFCANTNYNNNYLTVEHFFSRDYPPTSQQTPANNTVSDAPAADRVINVSTGIKCKDGTSAITPPTSTTQEKQLYCAEHGGLYSFFVQQTYLSGKVEISDEYLAY